MMTVSDTLDLEPQQTLETKQYQENEATKKKKPYKSTRYKRGVTNYRSTNYNNNTTRYYNEPLSAYPLNYMYYPSMSFPPNFEQNSNIHHNDEDLEIIMHDESSFTHSAETTPILPKPVENKTVDLKSQLEYYFSRQNLVNDTWLVSQMDSELYVPISLVANFKRVREWTTDIDVIVKALRESPEVTVDSTGTKVKPNISVQRKTVILRDVPECTEEEIRQLLQDLEAPKTQSIKKDIGNMWYFTFDSEEDALKLLLGVRGKSFKGQAIAARMKSEPALRVQTHHPSPSVQENVKTTNLIPEAYPSSPSSIAPPPLSFHGGYFYQPSLHTVYSNHHTNPQHFYPHSSYRPSGKKPFNNNNTVRLPQQQQQQQQQQHQQQQQQQQYQRHNHHSSYHYHPQRANYVQKENSNVSRNAGGGGAAAAAAGGGGSLKHTNQQNDTDSSSLPQQPMSYHHSNHMSKPFNNTRYKQQQETLEKQTSPTHSNYRQNNSYKYGQRSTKNKSQEETEEEEEDTSKHEFHKKKSNHSGNRYHNNRNHSHRGNGGGNRKHKHEAQELKPAHFPPLNGPEEQTELNEPEKPAQSVSKASRSHLMSYADMLKKKEVE